MLFPEHLRAMSETSAALFEPASPYLRTPFALVWGASNKQCRRTSKRVLDRRIADRGIATRYYSSEVHLGSFLLPTYVKLLFDAGIDTIGGPQ